MPQESATFDLRTMIDGPSTKMEIYIFLFLVAFIATAVKLVRVWWAAPPFRLSRQAGNPTFLVLLEDSVHSLKHWSDCTFFCWGMLTSLMVTELCDRLFYEKSAGRFMIVSVARELSIALTMAMLVILFSFLARWHMLKRIDHLRRQADRA